MKTFNLDLAKSGVAIITRDGRPVKFIAHVPDVMPSARVIVAIDDSQSSIKILRTYSESGRFIGNETSNLDLFHPSVKRSGWTNLVKTSQDMPTRRLNRIFKDKESAERVGKMYTDYLTTIEIHWEE